MSTTPDVASQKGADAGLTPDRILHAGFAFWGSKALLSAVELGVFTELARGPLDREGLTERLGLHPRSALDFFDTLVALGMLERHDGHYSNAPDADLYLDRAKPTYIGGMLEMANARLYPFWGSLTHGLRTGQPQNESKGGENLFDAIYPDPVRLRLFLSAMTGFSLPTARAIAGKFPWSDYKTFVDIGAAQGAVPVEVALAHPHLSGGGFDLPAVGFPPKYASSSNTWRKLSRSAPSSIRRVKQRQSRGFSTVYGSAWRRYRATLVELAGHRCSVLRSSYGAQQMELFG